jgi:hypothetical protein
MEISMYDMGYSVRISTILRFYGLLKRNPGGSAILGGICRRRGCVIRGNLSLNGRFFQYTVLFFPSGPDGSSRPAWRGPGLLLREYFEREDSYYEKEYPCAGGAPRSVCHVF